jgi:hypothetical protein
MAEMRKATWRGVEGRSVPSGTRVHTAHTAAPDAGRDAPSEAAGLTESASLSPHGNPHKERSDGQRAI